MRVIVDADATPDLDKIINLCKKYKKNLYAICDTTHNLDLSYGTLIQVDNSSQSTDVTLYNMCQKKDLIITQDYGLASLCLSKDCTVLNPNGFLYSINTIDSLLEQNREKKILRKRGIHLKGPKKRTIEVSKKFLFELENILKEE